MGVIAPENGSRAVDFWADDHCMSSKDIETEVAVIAKMRLEEDTFREDELEGTLVCDVVLSGATLEDAWREDAVLETSLENASTTDVEIEGCTEVARTEVDGVSVGDARGIEVVVKVSVADPLLDATELVEAVVNGTVFVDTRLDNEVLVKAATSGAAFGTEVGATLGATALVVAAIKLHSTFCAADTACPDTV